MSTGIVRQAWVRANSEKVKRYTKLNNAKRRKQSKENGICTQCHKEPSVQGRVRCGVCLAKLSALNGGHGCSYEQRCSMFEAQDGRCLICKDLLHSATASHVDHDHKSGKIRGLLCLSCNSGLGHFKESQDRLRSAIVYLEESA